MKQSDRRKRKAPQSRGTKLQPLPPAMNPEQIRLLRNSFAVIEPQAHIAALVFYRNLFSLDPALRPLFHSSIELQGRKLMEALAYTIATLEDPEKLIPALEAMGRRHVAYGAQDEHYATVVHAMMLTLEQSLAGAFTPEVRVTWKEALDLVAAVMKKGAEPAVQLKRGIMKD